MPAETEETEVNLNELIINSENHCISNKSQGNNNNKNSKNNFFNEDLNSSLDVNIDSLSNADIDLNKGQSVHSFGDNIYLNDSNESLKYYSLNEMSPTEKMEHILNEPKVLEVNEPNKFRNNLSPPKILRKPYKAKQRKQIRNKPAGNTFKRVKRRKNPNKCTKKEWKIVSSFITKKVIKNVPKTTINLRTKEKNLRIASEISTTSTEIKEEFPKTLKTEIAISKEHAIAIELPKPMIFKCESGINVRNKNFYQQPEFQPTVRIKRLKSEELLIPLRTKKIRKCRKGKISYATKCLNNHHAEGVTKRDLLIQQAFSLNPRIKLSPIKVNQRHSYDNNNNEQPSLYSRIITPFSISNDITNDYFTDVESKYFKKQELFSIFHSPTPERGSMFSGNIDSGVYTSTPTTFHTYENNRTLLLEIAAERAFINHHLMEFGHSPIQFQLYNDLNDLNVFLRYLLGQTNIN